MITIHNQSLLTGKTHSMTLDITPEAYITGLVQWEQGMLIQKAFPTLTADEREFIMTGTTPEEWDALNWNDEGDESEHY